jgi:hypothetical protein
LALLFAPNGSLELSLAFANRSAIFLELQEYKHSLRDIDLALRNGYPENLRPKLVERRLKCEKQLSSRAEENKNQCDRKGCENESYSKVRKYKDEKLFRLMESNPKIPSAENYVKILKHEYRGRELITTQDVPPGILSFNKALVAFQIIPVSSHLSFQGPL